MQQRAVGELWVAVETDRIKTRKTLPPLQGQRHGFPRLSRLGPIEASVSGFDVTLLGGISEAFPPRPH